VGIGGIDAANAGAVAAAGAGGVAVIRAIRLAADPAAATAALLRSVRQHH
jgi:thiamine-phosphate pyrophosphorylase